MGKIADQYDQQLLSGLGEKTVKYLEFGRHLVRHGYLTGDTESDGETFREVVEGLDALDAIRPAPRTTAPVATMRRLCFQCRGWYDGSPSSSLCPDCQAAVDHFERQTIERNLRQPPTRCTLCGAESRTFVCESCDKRPLAHNQMRFDYRQRLEQQAADAFGGGGPAVYNFCEDCGARLMAGFDDCSVCEGVGPGGYCEKCGTRKTPQMSLPGIPLWCPHCG